MSLLQHCSMLEINLKTIHPYFSFSVFIGYKVQSYFFDSSLCISCLSTFKCFYHIFALQTLLPLHQPPAPLHLSSMTPLQPPHMRTNTEPCSPPQHWPPYVIAAWELSLAAPLAGFYSWSSCWSLAAPVTCGSAGPSEATTIPNSILDPLICRRNLK